MEEVREIENCPSCPYRDHTGAFTPGGAKPVCGHQKTIDAKGYSCFDRVIPEPSTATPAWCPLLPNSVLSTTKHPDVVEATKLSNEQIMDMSPDELAATDEGMFEDTNVDVNEQIRELAEHVAMEMFKVEQLYKEHSKRKEALDVSKEQLCKILQEAGMESCKLECGLNPKAKVNRKIFKAEGVDDPMLHDWLREAGLGDVIIPYVHYMTLQSTLKAYEDQGGELPGKMFNVSLQPTITMNGKTKYLTGKGVM